MKNNLLQLYYYVPRSHLEITKKAIFAAGAGNIGNYSHCAWQTKGTGQFKPGSPSNPYIGKKGKVSKVIEYKVETVCTPATIKNVIKALKNSHPYEHPALGVLKLTAT